MALFRLPHIHSGKELVEISFRKGRKKAAELRNRKVPRNKDERILKSERVRIQEVSKTICKELGLMIKLFPNYEKLPRFYGRLLDIKIDKNKYKKSLGSVQWCLNQIKKVERESLLELKKTRDIDVSKKFLGRTSSLVKQVDSDFERLIEFKILMNNFPVIETDLKTLVIAGYPNVGKSTFMKTLTGSKVRIESYPFTTKNILIGHKFIRYEKYQIIDTPGLLDRKINKKKNKIELEAMLAIEDLSDKILFIFDLTQDFETQFSLLSDLKEYFSEESVGRIFVVFNKKDVTSGGENISEMKAKIKKDYHYIGKISAKCEKDCEKIFLEIFKGCSA